MVQEVMWIVRRHRVIRRVVRAKVQVIDLRLMVLDGDQEIRRLRRVLKRLANSGQEMPDRHHVIQQQILAA
jgi:hypothetical protein